MRLILLTLLLLVNLEAKSLFDNSTQADTSKYIDNLKDLIISTQKTRGLTNSYLNGNVPAMLLVYANRDNMKKAIGNMESYSLASDPVINRRATAISTALIKLNRIAFKQKPAKSFADYTNQIEQTLMLAQSVSKRFAKDLTPFAKESSTLMMETMLPMTEFTGRLRGLGAGIAAKGKATKDDAEKIDILIYQLTNANNQLQTESNQMISKYSGKLPSSINTELASINTKVQEYTRLAQKTLLKTPSKVNPDDYFDEGTDLISAIIKAYNTLDQAILKDSKGWF